MSAERPILIIEDDSALSALLTEQLAEDNEFHPVTAASLGEADRSLSSETARFDTLILDVGLPDGDGFEYCAKLRAQGHKMPIIMLTGAGDETDVVRGLQAGANDYIVKPFRLLELKARIWSQLRSFESSDDAVFTIGRYLFRPSARSLLEYASNRRIHLTLKEVELLKLLHRASNRVVGRQELLDQVWGYNAAVTTHTLETHVYRLRQKIERNPAEPRLLVTHRNGYCLTLEDVGAGEAWCAPHGPGACYGEQPTTRLGSF
jgi:DNA-binding response OmpR family regulator